MYLPIPYKIQYNTNKFPFQEAIQNILEVSDLSSLHKLEHYDKFVREKDQSTIWHKRYYSKYKAEFEQLYIGLLEEIKENFEYSRIIYQSIPTFRVQLGNGNLGVGEWHKDREYNHGVAEVNFWLPFMDTNEVNSVWMESKENKEDYAPHTVKYGEILVFNGANILHGNKENTSDKTRTSIDFRLVDPDKFTPSKAGSINTKTTFDIGGYFNIL